MGAVLADNPRVRSDRNIVTGAARLLGFLLLVSPPSEAGPDTGRVVILPPKEAAKKLTRYSVLDARGEEAHREGHIPGSVSVAWEQWTRERPGLWNLWFGDPARWGLVPEPTPELEQRLRTLGLSQARPILVVGDPGGWGEEGRMAWNLLYWGASEVALLDGGFPAWKAAFPGKVARGTAPPPPPGDFRITLRPQRRATLAEVRLAVKGNRVPLLDARTPQEYAGHRVRGQRREGRIPGAILIEQRSLYLPGGSYLDGPSLKARLPDRPGQPITYCVGGVRSALLALLIEARTGRIAANYDGSLWEWSAHPELPLEK